uniref:Smr domain-containing protein n=1 Tax=Rhodnius prolixus TaxID=13249 RepID=T1HBP2_RHOPR
MATFKENTLSAELKELIVHNIQDAFPAIVDKNVIQRVLKNENWDIEKAFHIFKKLEQEFSCTKNDNENFNIKNNGNVQTVQKISQTKFKENEKSNKNKVEKKTANMNYSQAVGVKQQRKNGKQENVTVKEKMKNDLKRSYDLIKQVKDPFDRIVSYGKSRIKVMVFMRGCSGSGKSTLAKEVLFSIGITEPSWFIFSADDYFIDPSSGKYEYNRELIQSAHLWNQKLLKQAVIEGRSPLIIDNTHTRLWEMQDNAKLGVEYGYVIETLEPKTPWFFLDAELHRKTTHNVSRETIRRMVDRYEPNLTGLDVIHLTGLTYTRPPPVRQIAELNAPPSKKSIKLFENRSVISADEQLPVFDQKLNTGKHVLPKTNRINQSNVNYPPNLAMFSGGKKQNRNPEISSRFPNIQQKEQQSANCRKPFYQDLASVSTGTSYQQPYTLHNLASTSHFMPFPAIGTWQESVNETEVQLNYINTDANFWQEATDETDAHNVATSFDLVDLTEKEDQPVISSNSQERTSNLHLPYEPDFTRYSNNLQEILSYEEPTDSDDVDEDENDVDDDEEEKELDEDSIESDSLEDVRNTLNSICTTASSGIVKKEEVIINLCKEYILVMPDEKILYQKFHNNFPNNLNDFKLYCAKENEDIGGGNEENNEGLLAISTENSAVKHVKDYEFVLDQTLLYQKVHAVDEPKTLKELMALSQRSINEIIEENKPEDTELNHNEGSLLKNCKACDVETNLDSTPLLVNKSMNTKPSTSVQFGACANSKSMEASSNTNYIDFEVLKQINAQESEEDYRDDVLIGRTTFKSIPFKFGNNYKHTQSTILMLDKSSMTCDVKTNHINNTDFGVDSLVQMFPTIKRENLEELLNKCGKDLDWAVGLLLDSGHEMSEFMPTIEQSENNENTVVFDNDRDVVNLEFESAATTSSSTTSSKTVNSEHKRKKKNHATLTDSSIDLIQNFQDKFKLNDDCYSENIMKLRKQRMLTVEDLESNLEKSTYENIPMETGEDSPETLETEEGLLEQEEEVDAEEEEEDERESDVGLVMDKNLVIQLQNKFGGLLSPNLIGEKTILHIPKSLARQLYCYTFDAVYEQMEQQQAVIDMLINEGHSVDAQEEERLKSQPSFQEIMDYEMAVRMSQVKDSKRANTAAFALSRKLLMDRFPNFDPSTLTSILEETNHSLHAATNLLTLAGHSAKTEESHEQEVMIKKEESCPLSREEAIQQAHAYSDVAGKLFEMREDCLNKAEQALAEGKRTVAQYYSEMAKWYMERIEQSNSLAANAMLNGHEGATTLDLHFLQVHQALKVLDLFLDDKIRANKRKTVVYIITGRGAHSPKGICKIKQAVQLRLRKRHISFSDVNPGMLRAHITKRAIVSYKKMGS